MNTKAKAQIDIEPGPPIPIPPDPSPAEPAPPFPDPLPQPDPEPPDRAAVLLRLGELPRVVARTAERRRGAIGGIVHVRRQVPSAADSHRDVSPLV